MEHLATVCSQSVAVSFSVVCMSVIYNTDSPSNT